MLNKEPNENSYQLVKKNDTGNNENQNQNHVVQTPVQITNQIIQQNENGDITVNLQTQQNKPHESSEHFKELQKLVKQNISPIENEVNKIMLKIQKKQ